MIDHVFVSVFNIKSKKQWEIKKPIIEIKQLNQKNC